MNLFPTIKVNDLVKSGEASLQTGPFGTQLKASDYSREGTPVINVRNVGFGDIRNKDLEFLDEKMTEKLSIHSLKKGDIVFGRKAAVERHALIDKVSEGWIQGSDCLRLRIDSTRINNKFVSYYLRTQAHQDWMQALCSFGATMASLNQDIVKLITLPLPPIQTQNKIAAVLSSYDDLIENNKRRIELLEKMAEEIYHEWFVRFRFPGWEQAEFEKGIPKGWKLEKIASLGKVVTGKTPATRNSNYYNGEIHFIKTPDMHDQTFIFRTEETLSNKGLEIQPSQVIPKNSICVSCIGTGGVVSITTQTCSTNQQINSLVLNNEEDLEWAFFTLKTLRPTILAFGSTGTTMTNLSKGKFSNLKLIKPPKEIRKHFSELTKPLLGLSKTIAKKNISLEETKNLLLPRLISGKLSVEDLDIQFPPSMQEELASES